jgi:hypothetical protein
METAKRTSAKRKKSTCPFVPTAAPSAVLARLPTQSRKLCSVAVSLPTTTTTTDTVAMTEDATSTKKVAVLWVYVNTHYGGFQINCGVRSVVSFRPIKLGIPPSTVGETGLGVHAAQAMSYKMKLSSRQLQALANSTMIWIPLMRTCLMILVFGIWT